MIDASLIKIFSFILDHHLSAYNATSARDTYSIYSSQISKGKQSIQKAFLVQDTVSQAGFSEIKEM